MPLTVVNVAYPFSAVGFDAVGGSEQVVAALDDALVRAGDRSIVVACAGSAVRGELIALPAAPATISDETYHRQHEACRRALAELLARARVDVVHLHGVDFDAYLPPPGPTVLATLHLPVEWYRAEALAPRRSATFVHGVSAAQVRRCPPSPALLPPIENGVDLDALAPSASPGDYAVVLARICPEKGAHLALDAATRAGVPLVLAGRVFGYPEHERYYRTEILPRLDGRRRFVGAVAGRRKARLLADATCAVVPSLVDETSSLVAMEALASGTPVVALRRGALADLIEDGVTGILVDDAADLAAALRDVRRLDRARCRAAAEARCSRRRMCERYRARYRELAAPRRRASVAVTTLDGDALAGLAPRWTALWERCPSATVFQRPEWLLAWRAHLPMGAIEARAAWRRGELVALLPIFRWRDGGDEVLSLAGAGVSDYLDALIAPGDGDAAAALAAAIGSARWDRLELSELRDGSPLLELAFGGADERATQEPCPALAIDPADPLAAVPAPLRREIAYQRRRAARELGAATIAASGDDPVGVLARLHAARWAARGEAGVLTPARRAFLEAAVAGLAARDAAVAVELRLGDEVAAVALVLLDRGVARYYLGGFDPAHARRGPGTLAIAGAIEAAAARGARRFDFLRGAEPYKYRFGARDELHLHRRVVRRRR